MSRRKSKVTIKDVAFALGVNPSTVSLVMNGSRRISAPTRERVLKVAREMGYIPDKRAQGLRFRRTRVLGIMVPALNEIYVPTVVDGAYRTARKAGYQLLIVYSGQTAEEETDATMQLLAEGADGVMLIERRPDASGQPTEHPAYHLLLEHGVPTALLGTDCPAGFNQVDIAMQSFVLQIMDAVLSRGRGASLITRHNGSLERFISEKQEQGFLEGMRKAGVADPTRFIFSKCDHHELVELGRVAGQYLVENFGLRQAILTANDLIAEGVQNYVMENGIRTGGDFTFVSLSDLPYSPYGPTAFASAIVPMGQCGESLAELVIGQINAGSNWTPRRRLFHPCPVTRHLERMDLSEEEKRELWNRQHEYRSRGFYQEFVRTESPVRAESTALPA
ncbi:MAG TPA: LacI family DNA-binding transcriptional regulator [Candidatus Sumerlaeota bacterium]|nr:LacI family DNA-binding transcriptional regulator [Candidatus Sumerlaeota bacterium]HOR27303.1 LacI family DNA-binding transcriptional regulator [Candidatus Sumerlaeota bacterium]HPK04067.1 LacI family DNA-binding transcriptional regulator [Candidatus Sumerlaeota bacterium]